MKLRSPSGCGGASYAGSPIEIDSDGYVDIDEDAAVALLAHGFEPVPNIEANKITAPDRSGDGIDRLKRSNLFALLKAEGISVSLPITNDELRALARQSKSDPSAHSSLKEP